MKGRAYRRHKDYCAALRKRSIAGDWYDNLHQYTDNKVHCSCPLCRCKTRDPMKKDNWPIPDVRRMQEMKDQITEFLLLGS